MNFSFDPYKQWNPEANTDGEPQIDTEIPSFLNLRRFADGYPRPAPSFHRECSDEEILQEAKDPLTIKLFEYFLKNPAVQMDATTLSEWFKGVDVIPNTSPTCPFGVLKRLRILSVYDLVQENPPVSGKFMLDGNLLRKDLHPDVLDFYRRTCDRLGLAEAYSEARGEDSESTI